MLFQAWLSSVFQPRQCSIRKSRPAPRRAAPSVEALEDRLATAITSFAGGVLTVNLNHANESATLTNDGANIRLTSDNLITGAGDMFTTPSVTKIVVTDPGNNVGQVISFEGSAA